MIEPSVSPWALPLVPVKKKDRQTRWVTDLRELNKQTVKDSYLLTNIQEILHSLQGGTVFSSLDACGAYHTVRNKPGSQACTTFISPFATFQYIFQYILTTDWSKENITGVLSQVQDGQERFLGCWGRRYKRNYPSYKGELLAMIQCIKKWKHILSNCPFKVHTNASALKYLTTMKNQSGFFMRWYQELAGLNFTVIHKKGNENNDADALNRSSHMGETPQVEQDEYAEF